MIVVDASAVLDVLLKQESAATFARRWGDHDLVAPHLIDLEVLSALRRHTHAKALTAFRASLALTDFQDLALERYEHQHLLSRIWTLRDSLSTYDAAYVALAEVLQVPLITSDKKLTAAHGHQASIRLL